MLGSCSVTASSCCCCLVPHSEKRLHCSSTACWRHGQGRRGERQGGREAGRPGGDYGTYAGVVQSDGQKMRVPHSDSGGVCEGRALPVRLHSHVVQHVCMCGGREHAQR